MKKLTAGIFATLLTMVSVDGAYAAIASKGYVDDKVGEVQTTVAGKADQSALNTLSGTVAGHTTQIGTINTKIEGYGDIVTHDASDFATAAQGALADTAVQPGDITNVERTTNKTQTVSAQSTDAQYPSAKAVWAAVSSVDANASVEALEGRVGKLETASATHATKSDLTSGLAGKQDKLSQTGSASQPVYVNEQGVVTAGNTIPSVTTNITTGQTDAAQAGAVAEALAAKANTADLGDLATLNAVGSAEITDGAVATDDIASKAVTKAKLADDIVTSLGKADSALQQDSLNGYLTKTAADTAYADIATEGVASTASTNAQSALTNIGDLSQLTTDAKDNTVAAINEVAKEAADAQSTATGAQSAVDAVESTIGGYGDIVTHKASEFATTGALTSGLAGKLDKDGTAARATADASGNVITTTYATKAAIADLATNENLALKQDKTDDALNTTVKTVVGAINEVKTTADDASTAAAAAQEDATKALADAATAQSAAQAAQTAANSKLPTATYNSEVGTVTAGNMGTTATTVVTAIKEVAGEAADAQSTASSANTAAGAAQKAAEAAQETANAAIPKPSGECSDPANKCVLTWNNSAYAWEVIARNGEGE